MPHQCLQCGSVFPEGSREILKGCPSCGGTKFFFTQAPLSDGDLTQMRRSSEEEMRELVKKVLTDRSLLEPVPETDDLPPGGGWVAVRPEELKTGYKTVDEFKRRGDDSFERSVPMKKEKVVKRTPEVIRIVESGVYEIDLESLLRKSPIVIQKDGTYLIYLPSLFSGGR